MIRSRKRELVMNPYINRRDGAVAVAVAAAAPPPFEDSDERRRAREERWLLGGALLGGAASVVEPLGQDPVFWGPSPAPPSVHRRSH